MPKQRKPDESLKGWAAIAKFLGQPVPTVQRWGSEGMPLTRIGRYVAALPAELERAFFLERYDAYPDARPGNSPPARRR